MKLTIYKYPEREEDYVWIIEIKERYAELWYEEVMRRFRFWETEVFDIDESFELWKISTRHLKEMINFLNK